MAFQLNFFSLLPRKVATFVELDALLSLRCNVPFPAILKAPRRDPPDAW
jgi:hypothetical protein